MRSESYGTWTVGKEKTLDQVSYERELIGPAGEAALLARGRVLPFREFESHGYTGRRRVVSFGWHCDFSGRQLLKAEDIPDFLLAQRSAAAAFAGMEPEELRYVLVTDLLSGPARPVREHSIPPLGALLYSVTFRHLREG